MTRFTVPHTENRHLRHPDRVRQDRAAPTGVRPLFVLSLEDPQVKRATLATLVLLIAAAALPAPASAALRDPQVKLSDDGANLQPQINILNGAGINVTTDQEDFMRWGRNISGSGTFTLSFAVGADLGANSIGVYNAVKDDFIVPSASDYFEIFPAATGQGAYALAQFNKSDNSLDVTLFDASDNIVSGFPKHYTDVHVNDFGFYIKNNDAAPSESNTGHGQDLLNSGDEARVLVFPGTGVKNGGWFLCFEDGVPSVPPAQALGIVDTESQDFDEAILFVEAIRPVPVNKTTWANLKSRFR